MKAEPENTVAKNMFHTVNQSTLSHALLSISLFEMYPWKDERKDIIGGIAFKNKRRMRFGR